MYKKADFVRKDRICGKGRVGEINISDHHARIMNNYPNQSTKFFLLPRTLCPLGVRNRRTP
jgi:hypothetical protein